MESQLQLKPLFQTYNTFCTIYQDAAEHLAFDREKITAFCKQKLLNDAQTEKKQPLYALKANDSTNAWYGYLCFSKGEALARAATLRQRYAKKCYTHELSPRNSATIEKMSLEKIFDDAELVRLLVERMAWLVPIAEEEIERFADNVFLKMLWYFDHHHEAQFLLTDGTKVFVPKQSKLDLSSLFISSDFVAVIDDAGQYGLIRDRRKKFLDEPDVVCHWACEYYYIHVEEKLAEVQREAPLQSDDYRDYLCEIVEPHTGKVIAANALCGSLDYKQRFLTVETNGLLCYVYVDQDTQKVIKSKPYATIVTRGYDYNAVQDAKTKLWGYTDKQGKEVIAPQYDDYAPFNFGYAVVSKEGKNMVIDEQGEVIIVPRYLKIVHDEDDYFFVKSDKGWALFKKGEAQSDFLDLEAILDESFVRKHLPRWMTEEDEIVHAVEETLTMEEEEKAAFVLKHLRSEQKRALQSRCYTLPLQAYIALFDTFKSQKDLEEAGLWYHPVKVRKIPGQYKNIIEEQEAYVIGWSYPSGASMFDMSVELPVMFKKKDGMELTLGIKLEDLVLVRV